MKTDPPVFTDRFYVDKIQFEHDEPFYIVRDCTTEKAFWSWTSPTQSVALFSQIDDTNQHSVRALAFCCTNLGSALSLLQKLHADAEGSI